MFGLAHAFAFAKTGQWKGSRVVQCKGKRGSLVGRRDTTGKVTVMEQFAKVQ